MPDQQPAIGETRTANGETRTWTGQGWAKVSRGLTDPSGAPMIQLPPRGASGRTDQQDLDVLKNFLNIGGAALAATPFGAASLPLRMGAAALGGAVGRTAGHGIEAMNKAARHDETGPSLGEDIGQGLVEGAGAEVAPAIVGKALGLGGRGLQAAGDFLGSGASPSLRGWIGHTIGGAPGAAAAAFGPPAISAVGSGAARAGEAIGTRTLSQRLKDALENSSLKSLFGEGTAFTDPYAPNVSGYRSPGSANPQAVGVPYEPTVQQYSPNVSGYTGGGLAEPPSVMRMRDMPPEFVSPDEAPVYNFVNRQSAKSAPEPYESARETLLSRRGSDARAAFEGETPRGGAPSESTVSAETSPRVWPMPPSSLETPTGPMADLLNSESFRNLHDPVTHGMLETLYNLRRR